MAIKTYYTNDIEYVGELYKVPYKVKTRSVKVDETKAFGRKVYLIQHPHLNSRESVQLLFADEFKKYAEARLYDTKEEALASTNDNILHAIEKDMQNSQARSERHQTALEFEKRVMEDLVKQEQLILKRIAKLETVK
jgi:hypothetical protein